MHPAPCTLHPPLQYHWLYSATAYNHAYNDSGIFCIHASCHPQSMVEMTQVNIVPSVPLSHALQPLKQTLCSRGRLSNSDGINDSVTHAIPLNM